MAAQNETSQWYFGNLAGLSFLTNPPTVLTNGALSNLEGCSTMADASGNLIMYTSGLSIWNRSHVVMPNGNGLLGNGSATQSGVIVKQPGNTNIYYVFSVDAAGGANGLRYAEVDLSLAAGMGSVTSKNNLVWSPSSEKITSVRHCNGTDVWVLSHDWLSGDFRANLVTAAGVNTVGVISTIGTPQSSPAQWAGQIKLSPNGRKIGMAVVTPTGSAVELFDFDAATGVVSNSLSLGNISGAYGCEFSPDGTKFYVSKWSLNYEVFQWDLCAGSPAAIISSQYMVAPGTSTVIKGAMQLAPDGKIYIARYSQSSLAVINSPNLAGAACNYVDNGQSLGPKTSSYGLPNFITSFLDAPLAPFTYSTGFTYGCQTASYTAPPIAQNFTANSCSSAGYSLTGVLWDFGDPASGSTNTSTAINPAHQFSSVGTFTTSLIVYYSCGGGTDTVKQVVTVTSPCATIVNSAITCATLGSATVSANSGPGPFSYTWMPGGQSGSVAMGLNPGTYTVTIFDFGNNFTYTCATTFSSAVAFSGNLSASNSITCNGALTATAAYSGISGGSGTESYLWSNGLVTYTLSNPNNLSAGLWSVTVTDVLSGCTIHDLFFINQPPAATITLSSASPTVCAGHSITLGALVAGGTPTYSYLWNNGSTTNTTSVTQATAGIIVNTLTILDAHSCQYTHTIGINYIPNPIISAVNVSICPLQTATLTATGATGYTWSTGSNANMMITSPATTSQYTVIGSSQSCTAQATPHVYLYAMPNPNVTSNSPVCEGDILSFTVSAASSYVWTGANGFASVNQINTISSASLVNAGAYQVTVTTANSCTTSSSFTVTVHLTPTVSASGATVCNTQTVYLAANSVAGVNYNWHGPNGFVSALQNPSIASPSVSSSGNYTVKVSSAQGCTNSAITSVTVTGMPIVNLNTNSPVCTGETINLVGQSNKPGVTYSWSGPNSFSSALQNPVINGAGTAAAGVYSLDVILGPCIANKVSQPLIINALPTATITSNSPVCVTKAMIFSAISSQATNSYTWHAPGGVYLYGTNPQRDSATLAYNGNYTLSIKDSNGCKATVSASAQVIPNPVLRATGDTVCLNSDAILKAVGADTYNWYNASGIMISAADEVLLASAVFTSASVYTVVGKSVNTCTSSTTATVMTRPLPIPELTIEPSTRACLNTTLTFRASGATHYTWAGPANTRFIGKELNIAINNIGYSGVYTLTGTDANGCSAIKTTTLTVNNLPGGSLQADRQEGCAPFKANLYYVLSPYSARLLSNSWFLNGKYLSSQNDFSYTLSKAGEYKFTGELLDTNGCSYKPELLIKAYDVPQADFTYMPQQPVEGAEVLFTNKSKGAIKFNWYFLNTQNNNADEIKFENPSVTFETGGSFPVVLVASNQWGCSDTLVKTIRVEDDFVVYVPNAFTPNDDDHNEVFLPVIRGAKFFTFSVFDRWGEKIFETKTIGEGWNGKRGESPCKSDTYVWKLILSGQNGEQRETIGKVNLYR